MAFEEADMLLCVNSGSATLGFKTEPVNLYTGVDKKMNLPALKLVHPF